jgi:hypothetical protein
MFVEPVAVLVVGPFGMVANNGDAGSTNPHEAVHEAMEALEQGQNQDAYEKIHALNVDEISDVKAKALLLSQSADLLRQLDKTGEAQQNLIKAYKLNPPDETRVEIASKLIDCTVADAEPKGFVNAQALLANDRACDVIREEGSIRRDYLGDLRGITLRDCDFSR